jgi:hypothetical protein
MVRAVKLCSAVALLAAVAVAPVQSGAASPKEEQLLVLPVNAPTLSRTLVDAASDRAGARALALTRGKFRIITRDMLAAVVGEEKLLKCEDEARCELDLGAAIGSGFMVSTHVRPISGRFEVLAKVYDVRKLSLLAQTTVTAQDEAEVLARVDEAVDDALARGLRLGPGSLGLIRGANGCPAGTRLIPGGSYTLGRRGDAATVKPVCIDVTEVTVAAWGECMAAGKCKAEKPECGVAANWGKADRQQHPMSCVSWEEAVTYCAWAMKRLPSEEEWEWAARGGEAANKYPWGAAPPTTQGCWNGAGNEAGAGNRQGTCTVGAHPTGDSLHGLKDLGGNVWEWTATASGDGRVYRGGSWTANVPTFLSASSRYSMEPAFRDTNLGFRCAVAPEERKK